jgi:hypothetical protein
MSRRLITFDHMKLVNRDEQETTRYTKMLAGFNQPGVFYELSVMHEDDGSCCKKEAWSDTHSRIARLRETGNKLIPINVDHTSDKEIMRADIVGSDNKSRTMGTDDWLRHEEKVSSMSGVIDIGIGDDAVRVVGKDASVIGSAVRTVYHELIDGGANAINLNGHRLYVRRRGKHVDVGTRRDFEALG